jgi:DNA-binding CsgD family transcriptional regulator
MSRGRPRYEDILTPREWEVLGLLREGLTNEQIAHRLAISANTAKFHVAEILSKLGVSSRDEAARWQRETERSRFGVLAPLSVSVRKLRLGAGLKVTGVGLVGAACVGLALLVLGVVSMNGRQREGSGGSDNASVSTPLCTETGPAGPQQSPTTADQVSAWVTARDQLPADTTLYRPTDVPDRFGPPQLLEACITADSVPQYVIRYAAGDDTIDFVLNTFTNIPGPPESITPVDVHGLDGSLFYTVGSVNQRQREFFDVAWDEGEAYYQIRAASYNGAISSEDLLRIAQSLEAVR